MRERYQSRACAYPLYDGRWAVLLFSMALALCLAWSSVAQQRDFTKPAEPEDLPEEVATSDVPDSQVKKITIEGEGAIEVLDVDQEPPPVTVKPSEPSIVPDAPRVAAPSANAPELFVEEPDVNSAAEVSEEDLTWDERVTRDLTSLLEQDPRIDAETVKVDSKEGRIELTGTVTTLGAKNRAGKLARMMRGVQQVENELVVQRSEVDDATVHQYVHAALGQEPSVDSDAVRVKVTDGEVELSGSVDSWQQKQLVEEVTSQTRGVVAVDNQLTVAIAQSGSDEDIAGQVRQRLRSDPYVAAENVSVAVNEGKVNVTGMVHSIAQRDRVVADAWVRGVQSVDTSDLRIVPMTQAQAETSQADPNVVPAPEIALTPMTNEEVQEAVLSTLAYSPRLREFQPRVSADNGVVILEGNARTMRERLIAEQLAREVRGVYSVENNIEVRAEKEYTDTELADQVREAIDGHPNLSRLDVAVTVMEGAAYLSGTLTSPTQQRDVQQLAATVPGITKIYNETNLAEGVAQKTDFELKQDIETALYWSPYVDLDTIAITVTQGIATLDGTVERWASRLAAEDVAQQVGAVQVNNRLRVLEGPVEMQAQGRKQITVPVDEGSEIIIRD